MKATANVYKTSACLDADEVTQVSGIYQDDYGSPVDGTDNIYERWVKNKGEYTAPNVRVRDIEDPRNFVQYSKNGTSWGDSAILGDLLPGVPVKFLIKIAFPYGATEGYDVPAKYRITNKPA